MKQIFVLVFFSLCVISSLTAQVPNTGGHLSGSFESYTQLYQKDTKINAVLPQDKLGSNNFLKLDYNYKNFTAGVQFESYLPSIAGFPFTINQSKLVNRYFKYTAPKFSVQIGDFYEQFGSGLVFRSWENRQIGINNALEGANIKVSPLPFINIKAVYGRQRKVFDYANSIVRGADLEIDFTNIKKNNTSNTTVVGGFSFVSRYQQYTGPDPEFKPTVKAVSTRLDVNGINGSISAEYVHKSKDQNAFNNQDKTSGKAFLVNASYAKNNLGINLSFRSMENMDFRGERDAIATQVPVNFIPALTKQHDYLTTNIYVYNAQSLGETGGQVDVFYNFKGNAKKPSKVSLNFAHYQALKTKDNIFSFGSTQYYRDLSLEWAKKWNEKWSTTIAYHNLFYNKTVVEAIPSANIDANIIVLAATHKFTKKNTLRMELQNLFTKQDNGNWFAAVAELGLAPELSFFVSDLYNYGTTDTHYPNIGGSYTKAGTRFGLGYGRQRAGLFCVGGICRFVPAATGVTATLTVTFNN